MSYSRVTITIEMGNDDMQNDTQLAAALRRLADRYNQGQEPTKVMDLNGNSVGTVEYT